MTRLPDDLAEKLMNSARDASAGTYSVYSGFAVGAAVLTTDGNIYKGSNVENASYSLTICAERVALSGAISFGDRNVTAIAVYAPSGPVSPCGACRQFILEFGKDIIVIFRTKDGVVQIPASELLPYSFGPDDLPKPFHIF